MVFTCSPPNFFLSFQIRSDDNLSQLACNNCLEKLNTCIDIISSFKDAQLDLQKSYGINFSEKDDAKNWSKSNQINWQWQLTINTVSVSIYLRHSKFHHIIPGLNITLSIIFQSTSKQAVKAHNLPELRKSADVFHELRETHTEIVKIRKPIHLRWTDKAQLNIVAILFVKISDSGIRCLPDIRWKFRTQLNLSRPKFPKNRFKCK